MEFKRILLNRSNFTTSTGDLNIPADNVKYLDIGLQGMQCGGTACDFATLGATLDTIQITLGGENICNLIFRDLLTLNHIWEDIYPHLVLGAGAGNNCYFDGVRLPLHVTKYGKNLSVKFNWLTNANINQDALYLLLSCAYQYREQPFASHFNYQYRVTLSTAAWQEISLDYAGAECIGILLYSTTIPTTAAVTTDISEVKLLVDDREVYHEPWGTMTRLHLNVDTNDDANWGAETDNYLDRS